MALERDFAALREDYVKNLADKTASASQLFEEGKFEEGVSLLKEAADLTNAVVKIDRVLPDVLQVLVRHQLEQPSVELVDRYAETQRERAESERLESALEPLRRLGEDLDKTEAEAPEVLQQEPVVSAPVLQEPVLPNVTVPEQAPEIQRDSGVAQTETPILQTSIEPQHASEEAAAAVATTAELTTEVPEQQGPASEVQEAGKNISVDLENGNLIINGVEVKAPVRVLPLVNYLSTIEEPAGKEQIAKAVKIEEHTVAGYVSQIKTLFRDNGVEDYLQVHGDPGPKPKFYRIVVPSEVAEVEPETAQVPETAVEEPTPVAVEPDAAVEPVAVATESVTPSGDVDPLRIDAENGVLVIKGKEVKAAKYLIELANYMFSKGEPVDKSQVAKDVYKGNISEVSLLTYFSQLRNLLNNNGAEEFFQTKRGFGKGAVTTYQLVVPSAEAEEAASAIPQPQDIEAQPTLAPAATDLGEQGAPAENDAGSEDENIDEDVITRDGVSYNKKTWMITLGEQKVQLVGRFSNIVEYLMQNPPATITELRNNVYEGRFIAELTLKQYFTDLRPLLGEYLVAEGTGEQKTFTIKAPQSDIESSAGMGALPAVPVSSPTEVGASVSADGSAASEDSKGSGQIDGASDTEASAAEEVEDTGYELSTQEVKFVAGRLFEKYADRLSDADAEAAMEIVNKHNELPVDIDAVRAKLARKFDNFNEPETMMAVYNANEQDVDAAFLVGILPTVLSDVSVEDFLK